MKKIAKYIYCGLFLAICIAPLIAYPFVKSNDMLEKKALTEIPSYIEDGKINTHFSDEFNSYLNDNFPFRSELLTASNFITSELLSSPSSNVITGSDGWLYYQSTTADYMDTNAFDKNTYKEIIVTLSLIQERVEEKGGKFVFAPTPNKNSVYPENMPVFYTQAEENNYSRLLEKLSTSNVNYVDIKTPLIAAKSENELYHKRDTHWNNLGAKIGYSTIMEALGKKATAYSDAKYTVSTDWYGDLDKMLYPSGGFADDEYYYDMDTDSFRFTSPRSTDTTENLLKSFMSDKEENDNDIVAVKNNTTDNSSLYMIRDSFGRALIPYMIESYDTAHFARTNCPDINSLADGTDVVYEIAERNLKNIIDTCPFMYAPKREVTFTEKNESQKNAAVASDEGYAIRVYGTIDESMYAEDGRVYVTLKSDKNTYTFEAFPIYETDLLEKAGVNTGSSTGFSLMLDKKTLESGDYSISIGSGNEFSNELTAINIKEKQE